MKKQARRATQQGASTRDVNKFGVQGEDLEASLFGLSRAPAHVPGFQFEGRACEASVRGNGQQVKTIYAPQLRLTTLVLDGLRAGAAQAGLWRETVALTAALRIALTVPDAVERWLKREPVFASARLRKARVYQQLPSLAASLWRARSPEARG